MRVLSTPVTATSVTAAPQRPTVIRAWRMPVRMRPVVFVQGRANNALPTSVNVPPIVGKIPFPRPLRPARITATRTQYVTDSSTIVVPHLDRMRPLVAIRYPLPNSRISQRSVIARTWTGIPGPTESIVVRQPLRHAPVRRTIFQRTNTLFPPIKNWKQATTLVPRYVPRRSIRIAFAHSPQFNAPNVVVPNRPVIVGIPRRVKGVRPNLYSTRVPVFFRPRPSVIALPKTRPIRPRPYLSQIAFTSPVGGKNRPIPPLVMPVRRRRFVQPPVVARTTALTSASTNVWTPRLILPIVVPLQPIKLGSKRTIRASLSEKTPSTIIRPPYIGRRIARAVTKANTISMATRVPTGDNPDPIGEPLYDIIAASIAYLRVQPAIVSAFSDSPTGGQFKFTSDLEPRSTDPPYAVFYEPQEVESFDTTDGGDPSSLIEGVYRIDVFATKKLVARQLSENLADALNDAPLVFTNGVLIYLRRVQRQYPTLEVPGTGTNATMFKRMIEFEYKFERSYTLS